MDKARKKTEFSFFELSIESHLYTPFKGMGGGGGGGCRPIGD